MEEPKVNNTKQEPDKKANTSSIYECTICLDGAKEPVVTKCGHIYCWPCLYSWLESKGNQAKCPNCKNPISKDNIIPIYTKEESSANTNRFDIPNRPKGERNPNPPEEDSNRNNFFFGNNSSFSFGFFPFMGFNFNMQAGGNHNNTTYSNNSQNIRSPIDSLPENTKKAIINLFLLFGLIYLYSIF